MRKFYLLSGNLWLSNFPSNSSILNLPKHELYAIAELAMLVIYILVFYVIFEFFL